MGSTCPSPRTPKPARNTEGRKGVGVSSCGPGPPGTPSRHAAACARLRPAGPGSPFRPGIRATGAGRDSNLNDATQQECVIAEIAADKGYNKTETLVWAEERGIRTYIPEAVRQDKRRWDDKPEGWREACYENRRRVARRKGKDLQRRRGEFVERTFAHVCETGRARRSWIRGIAEVSKRYLMQVAAHNLGVILRKMFGVGTPRGWGNAAQALRDCISGLLALLGRICHTIVVACRRLSTGACNANNIADACRPAFAITPSSTGC